jgi:hypothetical protein
VFLVGTFLSRSSIERGRPALWRAGILLAMGTAAGA